MAGDGGDGRLTKTLAVVATAIAIATGGVTLLFHVRPELQPCLGGARASFTGAPVFPQVRFRDHLIREGARREEALKQPNLLGAEVRFSYHIENLRGAKLPLVWSLVTVRRDGIVTGVVPGEDRALALLVQPDRCGESGGKDLFVPIPARGERYRVVLELYRDVARADRLALFETATFQG
jgi:hypothetical protein